MKISTKGRYGLRILADLALHDDGSPRLIREISASQDISEKYAGRLIIELRRAGFLRSVRGAKGGYVLTRKPSEITLLEVIEVMEGETSIVDCVACPGKCPRSKSCGARGIWAGVNSAIRNSLARATLEDVVKGAENAEYCI